MLYKSAAVDVDIGTRVFVFEAGLAIIVIKWGSQINYFAKTIRPIDGVHCSCSDAGSDVIHGCGEMRLVKEIFGPIYERG